MKESLISRSREAGAVGAGAKAMVMVDGDSLLSLRRADLEA